MQRQSRQWQAEAMTPRGSLGGGIQLKKLRSHLTHAVRRMRRCVEPLPPTP
jgi:hypothetical protein